MRITKHLNINRHAIAIGFAALLAALALGANGRGRDRRP
jgi:hypothetical protein